MPVYEVTYEYEGKLYICLFSGIVADYAFCKEKPENAELKAQSLKFENELKELKKPRLKTGIIAFAVIPLAIILSYSLLAFMSLIIAIIPEIILVKKFIAQNNEVNEHNKKTEGYFTNLDEKRAAIALIVKEPNLSSEEQKEKIKSIISH